MAALQPTLEADTIKYKQGHVLAADDPVHYHSKLAPHWTGPYGVLHAIPVSD